MATSLALALGMSVASADCTTLSSTTTPIFCYGTNGSNGTNGTNGSNGTLTEFSINTSPALAWNGTNGGGVGSLYTLKTGSGSGSAVNITLQFNDTTDVPAGNLSSETYTITMGGKVTEQSQSPVLLLQSNRGIDMQSKTLTFNFGSQPANGTTNSQKIGRKMGLDLSGVTQGTSFKGNLTIVGGRAQKWYGENYFEAKFGSDVEGNITLTSTGGSTDIRSDFTFGGNLTGNLTIGIGSGNTPEASPLQAGNTFTFNGSNPTITGKLILSGTSTSTFNSNATPFTITQGIYVGANNINLNFTGSNITINNGSGEGNNYSGNYAIITPNSSNKSATFTFSANDSDINIGNVFSRYNANGLIFNVTGQNSHLTFNTIHNDKVNGVRITFDQSGTLSITNKKTGWIGTNQITFNQGGSLTGQLYAKGDSLQVPVATNNVSFTNAGGTVSAAIGADYQGKNNIVFNAGENLISNSITSNSGNNTINFGTGTTENSIIGRISASLAGGVNNITFSGSVSNTITGNIYSEAKAKNLITFTTDGRINGNLSIGIGGDGSGGTNTIDFQSNGEINGSLSTKGGTNTVTFTGDGVITGSVSGEPQNSIAASVNTISFNGTTGKIGGSVSQIGGGSNTITFSNSTSGTIGGNISAGTNSGGGAGQNTVSFNGTGTNLVSGNISSNKGSNTVSFNGTSNTVGGNIIAGGGFSSSANTIDFKTSSSTNLISGNVSSTSGTNTIRFSQDASSSIIEGYVSLSGGDAGSNIIDFSYNYSAQPSSSTKTSVKNQIGSGVIVQGYGQKTNTITATNGDLSIGVLSGHGVGNGYSIYTHNGGGNKNTITVSSGALTTSGGIGVNDGNNIINAQSATINGNIYASNSGASNMIRIANDAIFKGNISTNKGGSKNMISIAGGTDATSTFGEGQAISISANNGQNIISLGSNSNTLNLLSVTSNIGTNYIAKDIIDGSDANNMSLRPVNLDSYFSDTYAFIGSLSISEGVTGSGSGANYISYSATNSVNSAIISNLATSEEGSPTLGTAVSGSNNNIYLNVSSSNLSSGVEALRQTASDPANATQLKSATVILGNVVSSGGTNIKIVGTPNEDASSTPGTKTIKNKNQIGILGNIETTSGTTNIVLQDTFFAPSAIIVDNTQQPSTGKITMPFGGANAGNITTASGAVTNVVTRFTTDVNPTGISMYSVSGEGTTNIAIQGNIDVGTYINYGKGSHVNLFFANANGGESDSFNTATDINNNQVLGVAYQDGVKLSIADKTILIGDGNASFLDTYASYYTDGSTPLATVWADRTDAKDTVAIDGLVVGNISNLGIASGDSVTSKTYDVTLKSGSAFAGGIFLNPTITDSINIVMEEGSKLILSAAQDTSASSAFTISTLNVQNGAVDQYQLQKETLKQTNNVINIATGGASANNVATREDFNLLVIGGATGANMPSNTANTGLQGKGTAVFMTYVNTHANQDNATLGGASSSGKTTTATTRATYTPTNGQYGNLYSDRIIIANIGDNTQAQSGTYYMQFAVDADSKLNSVTYNNSNDTTSGQGGVKTAGNIAVLTVVNTGTVDGEKTAGITLKTQDVLQGFDRIGGDLIAVTTDINGVYDENGAYTTYFINTLNTRGATEATQDVTASAFATNYDLYFANFNSLNKRMGELRDNDNSQGAWARVFNGSQSNDFTKSTSAYTTFQAGYDYAFGFEGANNYLGVALSYAMSSSESDLNALDITGATKNINDVKSSAIEVALYNSYVQDEGWYNDTIAKFSYIMSDFTITGQESKYNTTNMAFTLSDEFGYRFKLGSEKEWYIDPQLEVALGYFNQSDFIQTLGLSSLEGVSDGIITMRSRFGSSFGYDFKKFTANKPIKASIYLGAFYEYDYISGGDVTLTTNLGGVTTSSSAVSSDGRVVMNVGTNMTIKDNTRIYFDFEKSFAGKITTDYQVNVGVRYSFGENTGYTPMTEKREVAPLKVSEENPSVDQNSNEDVEKEGSKQDTQTQEQDKKSKEGKAQ